MKLKKAEEFHPMLKQGTPLVDRRVVVAACSSNRGHRESSELLHTFEYKNKLIVIHKQCKKHTINN